MESLNFEALVAIGKEVGVQWTNAFPPTIEQRLDHASSVIIALQSALKKTQANTESRASARASEILASLGVPPIADAYVSEIDDPSPSAKAMHGMSPRARAEYFRKHEASILKI